MSVNGDAAYMAGRALWFAAQIPAVVPHPAPVVPLERCGWDDLPKGARSVGVRALRAGWVVTTWYALGTALDGRLTDQHVLAMRRGMRRAVATWHNGLTQGAIMYDPTSIRSVGTQGMDL
jgi:hypothetical protein